MPSSFCMLHKMLEYRKFLFTYVLDKQFILGTVFPSRQKISLPGDGLYQWVKSRDDLYCLFVIGCLNSSSIKKFNHTCKM